jgi:ribonuclease BN (tRNA processing enzyme)/tetratricopeptide (TPR) repeat protein
MQLEQFKKIEDQLRKGIIEESELVADEVIPPDYTPVVRVLVTYYRAYWNDSGEEFKEACTYAEVVKASPSIDNHAKAYILRLASNARRMVGEYTEAMAAANEGLGLIRFDYSPTAKSLMASLLRSCANAKCKAGEYEEAIRLAEQSIVAATNTEAAQSHAYGILAAVHRRKGELARSDGDLKLAKEEFEKSIAAGEEAIKLATKANDKLAIAHTKAGQAYSYCRIGEYEQAVREAKEGVHSAGEVQNRLAEAWALIELAEAMFRDGDDGYENVAQKALQCCQSAKGTHDEITWASIESRALQVLGRLEEAEEKAIQWCEESSRRNDQLLLSDAKSTLDRLRKELGKDKNASSTKHLPDGLCFPAVRDAFRAKRREEKRLAELFDAPPTMPLLPQGCSAEFQVLRRWASYTTADLLRPLHSAHEPDPAGGGYFLRWQDWGMVIDPGVGFGRAFREAGFVPRNISAVVVTHYHLDHMGDILPIVTWAWERGEDGREADRELTFLLASSVHAPFSGIIKPIENKKSSKVALRHLAFDANPHVLDVGGNKSVEVKAVRIDHKDLSGERTKGFGLRIGLRLAASQPFCSVGLTSDTRLLDTEATERMAEDFENVDLLVVHIGSLYPGDIGDSTPTKQHLGYSNAIRLMLHVCEKRKPSNRPIQFLVSEWGEELSEHRSLICDTLQKQLNAQGHQNAIVFPAAYRQRVALTSKEAFPICARHSYERARDWTDVSGIEYVCGKHHGCVH